MFQNIGNIGVIFIIISLSLCFIENYIIERSESIKTLIKMIIVLSSFYGVSCILIEMIG